MQYDPRAQHAPLGGTGFQGAYSGNSARDVVLSLGWEVEVDP